MYYNLRLVMTPYFAGGITDMMKKFSNRLLNKTIGNSWWEFLWEEDTELFSGAVLRWYSRNHT